MCQYRSPVLPEPSTTHVLKLVLKQWPHKLLEWNSCWKVHACSSLSCIITISVFPLLIVTSIPPGLHSYSHAVPPPNRLSQEGNLELTLRPNTGLLYKDAIAQLKNISKELMTCANTATCVVRLESLSIPTPDDFSLTGARYQPFNLSGKCFLSQYAITCRVQCTTYNLGHLFTPFCSCT